MSEELDYSWAELGRKFGKIVLRSALWTVMLAAVYFFGMLLGLEMDFSSFIAGAFLGSVVSEIVY